MGLIKCIVDDKDKWSCLFYFILMGKGCMNDIESMLVVLWDEVYVGIFDDELNMVVLCFKKIE